MSKFINFRDCEQYLHLLNSHYLDLLDEIQLRRLTIELLESYVTPEPTEDQIVVLETLLNRYKTKQMVPPLKTENKLIVTGQMFCEQKTIFTIFDPIIKGESRLYASEIYEDSTVMKRLSYEDMVRVISTVMTEQSIEDFLLES